MSACQAKSSKKPWSAKEDATLLRLIEEYGSCGSWPKIALHMEWRTGKQCRERYINQLDPNIKKTAWTADEDAAIIRLHNQLGNKWSKFMDYLPGRSDNAIKNRWHVISKDNCVDHNHSLQQAYENCQKHHSPRNASTAAKAKVRTTKKHPIGVKTENETSSGEIHRMPSVEEEPDNGMYDDLLNNVTSSYIDFDLGLFPDEFADADESSTQSMSPRTTNDFNDSAGEEPYHSLSFSYSKSSTDGMSSRESPVDASLTYDTTAAVVAANSARALTVAAALPVTPSEGSQASGSVQHSSPTAVYAATSPTSKSGSPTNKANLNIETNNSLYDFDMCFTEKDLVPLNALNNGDGSSAAVLQSRSDDSVRILQEAVCWQYDPNVDLAQALEFLMSATASPAGQAGPSFSSGSGSRPGSFRNAKASTAAHNGARSPNGSLFNLLEPTSPSASQRLRPLSGNVASAASMLMRSSSSTSGTSRVNCDPELVPSSNTNVPSTTIAASSASAYHTRPLPAHPQVASQQTAPVQRFSTNFGATGMPEHSPMNHTHFSPACPNSKRPRGKNPCHFW